MRSIPAASHAALEALPARQREIVSALKLRDESVKEVSQRLGMTESAVKVTAHRGYRALRRLLGKRRLMKTDDLIAELSKRATPVRPLPPPTIRVLVWSFVALGSAAAGILVFGAKPDLASAMRSTPRS